MAIFNSYVSLPEGISPMNDAVLPRLIVWIPTVDETPIFHRPQVLLLVLSPILISRHWPYPHHLCFHLFGGGNKDWGSQSHNGFLVTGPMTWNFLGILRNPPFSRNTTSPLFPFSCPRGGLAEPGGLQLRILNIQQSHGDKPGIKKQQGCKPGIKKCLCKSATKIAFFVSGLPCWINPRSQIWPGKSSSLSGFPSLVWLEGIYLLISHYIIDPHQ